MHGQEGRWASRRIGGRTAFADWYGNETASNSEGKPIVEMETGKDLGQEVTLLLDGVYTRGGMHFSEVACRLPGQDEGDRQPLLYQRLLAEAVDDAGVPVVNSIVQIIGLHQRDPMPGLSA